MTVLWLNEPRVLYQSENVFEFIPTSKMSVNERWNALVRGAFYFAIILFVTGSSGLASINILLLVMAATWAYTYYHTHRHDDTATKVDHTQHTLTTTEAFTPWAAVNGDDPFRPLPANIPREKHRLSKKACTKPTHQNPFMNVLVGEFRPNPTRPPACTEREYRFVKRDIQTHFDDALTKDANDIYNTTQSQREFFTMPYTTIPNKQGGFAHWLYG